MGAFNSVVITKKGIELIAKAQSYGTVITLTKAATGDGSYESGEDISSRTELKNKRMIFPLKAKRVVNSTNAYIKFVVTNYIEGEDLSVGGYYVTEIGLYAEDPDEGEILYAIAVSDTPDYLPTYNDLLPSTITVEMLIELANADNTVLTLQKTEAYTDETSGDEYTLGVSGGKLFIEDANGNRTVLLSQSDLDEAVTDVLNASY